MRIRLVYFFYFLGKGGLVKFSLLCCERINIFTYANISDARKQQEAEQHGRVNLMAVLGLAITAFHNKGPEEDYRKARRLFGKVIYNYPGCPAEVR